MSACAHRLEDGCAFVPCADACREVGGCVCKAEVKQDDQMDVLEAMAREMLTRLRSAQDNLDTAQALYDAAEDANARALRELADAIEARS